MEETLVKVKEYYGKTLKSKNDLQTSACCSAESSVPEVYKEALSLVDEEITKRFYGCGSPIPFGVEEKTVLDLGCGTGRDVFLLSYLVGEKGKVIGVDMTDEQLSIAKENVEKHMKKFEYKEPNVEFVKGFIEDLSFLKDNSVDIVVSNCVINLSPNKKQVFKEIFRVLKTGGELYFSDVFSDRRIPKQLKEDEVLYGECLSGALYLEDFRRMLESLGILDHRIISKSKIALDGKIKEKTKDIRFHSVTIRAFNLQLEDTCEDYGQSATYNGSMKECPKAFRLDDHHLFPKGKEVAICGNTALMLKETRFKEHFSVTKKGVHKGLFDCSTDEGCGC